MDHAKSELLLMQIFVVALAKIGKNGLSIFLSSRLLKRLFDDTLHNQNQEFSDNYFKYGRKQHWTLEKKEKDQTVAVSPPPVVEDDNFERME